MKIVGVDDVPPTITASALPAPNAAGWNNTNVAVNFTCSDAIDAVICPSAKAASTEGANQKITGTATDAAGNTETASVTLNIDKTPPSINIISPSNNATVASSSASVAGTVTDNLSGVAIVTCNGSPGTVQSGAFTCSVALAPGMNTITVQAVDVAGNVASTSESITLANGPSISSFSPVSGAIGTLVTLAGSNFTGGGGAVPTVIMSQQGGGTILAPVSTFSPTGLSFVVPDGAMTGAITVAVATQSATSSAPFTVSLPSSFSLTVGPGSATVVPGQPVAYAVSLNSSNGFSGLASLSISGTPPGVTASFSPTQISTGQKSILTITAPTGQAAGTAVLTISGAATINGQPFSQSANTSLQVAGLSTSFVGRTVVDDALQTSLAGVTVKFLGVDDKGNSTGCTGLTVSDAAGNFAFLQLPVACIGPQLIAYDGSTATSPSGKYAGVNLSYTLASGQATTPSVLIHLPRIDNAETVQVQQNSSNNQTFAFQSIPGLSVTVYAGTTFTLDDGSKPNPFPLVAIQVPVDRLPDTMPTSGLLTPFIVAFQPANAVSSKPVAVTFPNPLNVAPGQSATLMTLDPTHGYMVPYGTATVSNDGTEFVPDPDPANPGDAYGLVHFDWHGPAMPPPPAINPGPNKCIDCPLCSCGEGSNPAVGNSVDLGSGLEVFTAEDLSLSETLGPDVTVLRTYRSGSTIPGPFGIGTGMNYQLKLIIAAGEFFLVAEDGSQFAFTSQPDGTYISTSLPQYAGAVLSNCTSLSLPCTLRFKDGTTYQFQHDSNFIDFHANLISITDRNGNSITISRSSAVPSQILQVTDAVGRSFNFTLDSSGRVTAITDPSGRAVTYAYNSQGTLSTVTDANGGVTSYVYDGSNNLIQETDPRGIVVAQRTYDANGRVTSEVEADGGTYQFTYTPLNASVATSPILMTTETDPLGHQWTYHFSTLGFLLDATDPLGEVRYFTRDPSTNLITAITGTGQCPVCGDTRLGNQSFTYDANGNILTTTDALGDTTSFTYDPLFSQILSLTDPLGNSSSFSYDQNGNLLIATDANGHAWSVAYQSGGLPASLTDALGKLTAFSYDSSANLSSIQDALGNKASFQYDSASRLTSLTDPLGATATISKTPLDDIAEIVEPSPGGSIALSYDPDENLVGLTDERGNRSAFAYDPLDRLTKQTDPLGHSISRSYDLAGNLLGFVDQMGQTTQMTYDTANRLVGATFADGSLSIAYDSTGRLSHVVDSQGGTFDYSYDAAGRLTSQTSPVGAIQYSRDGDGRVTSRQVNGGATNQYTYDKVGNLLSATSSGASVQLAYDADDRLQSVARANGVTSQYAYDADGRTTTISDAGGALNNISYAYDSAGYRASQNATIGQPLITQAVASSFDANSELLQAVSANTTAKYTYNADGEPVSKTDSSGTTTYVWDGRGRLQSLTQPNGERSVFTYDFAGNLIAEADSGTSLTLTRQFLSDDLTNVAQILQNNGDNLTVLSGRDLDQDFAVLHSNGQVEYSLKDALNSTTATVDQTGKLLAKLLYEPYGQTTANGSDFPFQYTGRTSVAAGALYYLRARYYDATSGRFITLDPLGFSAGPTNFYNYVGSSPLNFRDPLGLEEEFFDSVHNSIASALGSSNVSLPTAPGLCGCGDTASALTVLASGILGGGIGWGAGTLAVNGLTTLGVFGEASAAAIAIGPLAIPAIPAAVGVGVVALGGIALWHFATSPSCGFASHMRSSTPWYRMPNGSSTQPTGSTPWYRR